MSEIRKRCTKCHNNKVLNDFFRNRTGRDGYRSNCKACQDKAYRIDRSQFIEYDRVYQLNLRHTDPLFKLKKSLRKRLRQAIHSNSKGGSAVADLGCSIEELKKHIESKFQTGMNWDNWSFKGWHIDHIVPLSSFDLSNPEELKKACHYTNLQPLWWKDNLKKSDKAA